MSMRTLRLIIFSVFVILLLTLSVRNCATHHKLSQAEEALARSEAEAAGYRVALTASEDKLRKLASSTFDTPTPPSLTPTVLTRVVTKEVPVTITVSGPSPTCPIQPSQPVVVHDHTINLAAESFLEISLTPKGTPEWRHNLFVDIRTDAGKTRVNLPPDLQRTSVIFSNEVSAAFRYYADRPSRLALLPRSPRHWRLGWSAGAALVINPFTADAEVGIGALFGVQF